MTEQPVAWVAAGMIVREDGGSVSLADIEAVWDAIHEQLSELGLRVAATRALPVSQAEMESGDVMGAAAPTHRLGRSAAVGVCRTMLTRSRRSLSRYADVKLKRTSS